MAGRGYVGFGQVVREACPVREFKPVGYDSLLLNLPLRAGNMGHTRDDLDRCEWVVGIKWVTTVAREDAKTFPGAFANPAIVCRLSEPRTLEFLEREFVMGTIGLAPIPRLEVPPVPPQIPVLRLLLELGGKMVPSSRLHKLAKEKLALTKDACRAGIRIAWELGYIEWQHSDPDNKKSDEIYTLTAQGMEFLKLSDK
jgi:hypothetical protein